MKMSRASREIELFIENFLYFGRNTNIGGLQRVFQVEGNILSRTFWLLILVLSFGCIYFLLVSVVERRSDISYIPDTQYLHWNTTFPAVTVCEAYNSKLVQKKLSENYPELMQSLNYDFKRYLSDLMYGRGTCSKTLCVPCGGMVPCDLPWTDVKNIHRTCEEIISQCTFNGQNFTCCNKFFKVDSEHGPCFSINSQLHRTNQNDIFVVNRTTGPGILSFTLLVDAHVSIHSSEELSTNNLDGKFKFDVKTYTENRVKFLFSLVETENDPLLNFVDKTVRRCRYHHETPNSTLYLYPVYSYGACKLARKTEQSFRRCGCIHPIRQQHYSDKYCNYTGLNCLVAYEAQKNKLGLNEGGNEGECLPSCVESELTTVHVSKWWDHQEKNTNGTSVTIQMASLPRLRYRRILMRNNLDLVVSVGGMVGLFFGASILSVVEILYLILRK